MEVLKISDSKLKIMLTKADMQKYGLHADKVDYNDAPTRRSFFRILDSIKSTHGFDTEGDKVLIQFYPSRDGGCELFVTKLGLLPVASERAISRSDRVTTLTSKRAFYRFSSLSDLICAVSKLGDIPEAEHCDVYRGEDLPEEYYLEITERASGRLGAHSEFDILLEYAERVDKILFPYITEHCERLSRGDGVSRLLKNQ